MKNNQKVASMFKKGSALTVGASKRMMGIAVLAAIAVPAYSQSIDNPLYSPEKGSFYIKPALGLMYKKSNDNLAMQAKNHVNETEFPVGRINFDAGYGLTDRLTARLGLGWTQNDEISRKGAHNGRLGLSYRLFDGANTDGWVWDVYADAWLGGLTKMEADLVMSPNTAMVQNGSYPLSFNYDSFSHGRFGAWAGTLVGKTWDKLTASVFIEGERTFGNNNNDIRITNSAKPIIASLVDRNPNLPPIQLPPDVTIGSLYVKGLPSSFNVDTKSTTEYSGGVSLFYELNDNWSLGGAFTYKHRATNSVEAVNLDVNLDATGLPSKELVDGITKGVENNFIGSLQDGWNEYILTLAASRKLTNSMRLSLYGEYTFDNSEPKSQNGTSVKAEAGFRLSVKF